jgi:hypothetical protein
VDIAVEGEVVGGKCVYHLLGFLGGGGVVEVDQPMAVDLGIENGKIHNLYLFILDVHDCQKDEDEGQENVERPAAAPLGQRTVLTGENTGKLDFIINLFGCGVRAGKVVHLVFLC